VFYDESSSSGKMLAQSIQNSLNSMEESVTDNSPLIGDYFMLKCTDNPSVIVECGFLSNAEDEKLLIDTSYQKALAYAIFKGAVSFYS
jgi:N-acetylmuramoyl-L-alanine amidase